MSLPPQLRYIFFVFLIALLISLLVYWFIPVMKWCKVKLVKVYKVYNDKVNGVKKNGRR